MAIRQTVVDPSGGRNINFPKSSLALKYCQGKGLEIGSGAHNSFGLDSLNVSPGDAETEVFRKAEVEVCGSYDEIDIIAEGDDIPVDDQSQDYVISSHVFEHFPNPSRALREWYRIVKNKGVIFIIAPKRDSHEPDKVRPLSTLDELIKADDEDWTIETAPVDVTQAAGGKRGHYFVWTLELAMQLVDYVKQTYGCDLSPITWRTSDDKVSNGWCLILRVYHPAPEGFVFNNENQNVLNVNSMKTFKRETNN